MNKYLSIVTGDGTELVPIGTGLYVDLVDASSVTLAGQGSTQFELTTSGATAAMVNAINDALLEASKTNWRNTTAIVALPEGETVTSISYGPVA